MDRGEGCRVAELLLRHQEAFGRRVRFELSLTDDQLADEVRQAGARIPTTDVEKPFCQDRSVGARVHPERGCNGRIFQRDREQCLPRDQRDPYLGERLDVQGGSLARAILKIE